MTEPSGAVEAVAQAIYLSIHADKGGRWECVEPLYRREVWGKYARAAIAAMPNPSDQEGRISELEEALEASTAIHEAVVAAVDAYNEENGTSLCGGALFGSAKIIAGHRALLARPERSLP